MNIESVRTVATATDREQPERKTSVTRLSAYVDASASRASSGLSAEKRITAVDKAKESTGTDSSSAASRVPDSKAVSNTAQALGKLRQIADSDPDAFSTLLTQGASEIKSAITDNAVQDPDRMARIAENFEAAAKAQSTSDLDGSKLQGSTPADNQLTTALLARADAVLGIAPAPFGPWFPR